MPPDPVIWPCQGVVSLWRAFMLICMLQTRNDLKVFHSNQVNTPSNIKLDTSLINFECQPCGMSLRFIIPSRR